MCDFGYVLNRLHVLVEFAQVSPTFAEICLLKNLPELRREGDYFHISSFRI